MTYSTLMVHCEVGRSNAVTLRIVGELAEQLDVDVIGITACKPMQVVDTGSYVSTDLIEQDRHELDMEINAAEDEFRNSLHRQSTRVSWRSAITFDTLSGYLAHEARSADLFITGVDQNTSLFDTSRHVNISDLVMQIGRPVFIVPADANMLKLDRVVVGWKDTRETRRATLDSLPLLKVATHVSVVEITGEEDLAAARANLADVVGWLKRHGVVAKAYALPSNGKDALQLNALAQDQDAGIIVAGAYGHSRLREWVLGGVTRDLLLHAERCSLISH